MSNAYIVGAGMTSFGKFLERSLKSLAGEAVSEALKDAGCPLEDVKAAWFANASQGAVEDQHNVRGQLALRSIGFEGIPIINVENACASASTALNQAVMGIKSGEYGIAIAVGAEKMYSEDKERTFRLFNGAWDVHEAAKTYQELVEMGRGIGPEPEEARGNRSVFMDIYAALARFHMKKFGTTQRQLAMVSSKNHYHSTFNPKSQYRSEIAVDEVLNSRLISWPFTLPMCAPISDGAAAVVLCGEEWLDRFHSRRAVKVMASVIGTGVNRKVDEVEKNLGRLAALRAYDQAGIGPEDISVAEVHDATAFAEIQQCENLGFCELGQGGALAESGATRLGGRIPVNPSGGLESKGHPIGATGLGQIHELVTQLRGEAGSRQVPGARLAIAENGGGFLGVEEAVVGITILGRL